MRTAKTTLTIALATAALALGSLTVTPTTADAKGWKGFHKHGHFHRWHGHRWHKRFFFGSYYPYYEPCYFVRKPSGRLIKVCPY